MFVIHIKSVYLNYLKYQVMQEICIIATIKTQVNCFKAT